MTDARALLQERFGADIVPLHLTEDSHDTDSGRRARFIATMHALIAFFLEHNVPTPRTIGFAADVATLEELMALAVAADTHVYPADRPAQLTIYPLGDDGAGAIYVPLHVTVAEPERPL